MSILYYTFKEMSRPKLTMSWCLRPPNSQL